MDARVLSTFLELIVSTSSDVVAGMALKRSKAFVMAPVYPVLERMTAARSVGGLLLRDMAR